jgi:hypothetical protein
VVVGFLTFFYLFLVIKHLYVLIQLSTGMMHYVDAHELVAKYFIHKDPQLSRAHVLHFDKFVIMSGVLEGIVHLVTSSVFRGSIESCNMYYTSSVLYVFLMVPVLASWIHGIYCSTRVSKM